MLDEGPERPEVNSHLFTDASTWATIEARRDPMLEDTVVRGVRKNLFGPEDWPKPVVKLGYRTRRIGYLVREGSRGVRAQRRPEIG